MGVEGGGEGGRRPPPPDLRKLKGRGEDNCWRGRKKMRKIRIDLAPQGVRAQVLVCAGYRKGGGMGPKKH